MVVYDVYSPLCAHVSGVFSVVEDGCEAVRCVVMKIRATHCLLTSVCTLLHSEVIRLTIVDTYSTKKYVGLGNSV